MPKPPATDPFAGLSIADLSDLYNQYKGDTSEDGARTFAQIRSRLLRVMHSDLHPDEETFTWNVPYAADGAPFTINGIPMSGYQENIPACVMQTLTDMVWRNKQVEADRMREGGRIIDLGDINARMAEIQRS